MFFELVEGIDLIILSLLFILDVNLCEVFVKYCEVCLIVSVLIVMVVNRWFIFIYECNFGV